MGKKEDDQKYTQSKKGKVARKRAQDKFKKNNPNAARDASRRYRAKHPERVTAISKRYSNKKYNSDESFRIKVLLRSRLNAAMKGKKSKSLSTLIGCSIEDLRLHLERQFQPGMNWNNQGEWHIDHIIPCAKFDLTDDAQLAACWHYTNLQPLWGLDNIRKGDKYELKLLKKSNNCIPRTDAEKQIMIHEGAIAYGKFMDAVGIEWRNDPHAIETPMRVAKAWINDIIWGCVNDLSNVKSFPNTEGFTGLICQTQIPVNSLCCHHHLPFVGVAHVAYIPGKTKKDLVIGLSKLNRIVDWYSRRPNIQESLTKQIHDKIDELCKGNRGIAVVIESQHNCVKCRGIKNSSTMKTSQMSGYFFENAIGTREEFFHLIDQSRVS